jgi:hypothetical protein
VIEIQTFDGKNFMEKKGCDWIKFSPSFPPPFSCHSKLFPFSFSSPFVQGVCVMAYPNMEPVMELLRGFDNPSGTLGFVVVACGGHEGSFVSCRSHTPGGGVCSSSIG